MKVFMIRYKEINNLNKEEKWLKMKVATLLIKLIHKLNQRNKKKSNCRRSRLRQSI